MTGGTRLRHPEPVIAPGPDAAPFWAAARRHELLLPYCTGCERFFFYPRTLCPRCGARSVAWRPSAGRGVVHTFCIQYRAGRPGFREATPFVTAIVELDEGPRLTTFLVDVLPDPASIACGMRVEVAFSELTDGQVLPVFRPVQAPLDDGPSR